MLFGKLAGGSAKGGNSLARDKEMKGQNVTPAGRR